MVRRTTLAVVVISVAFRIEKVGGVVVSSPGCKAYKMKRNPFTSCMFGYVKAVSLLKPGYIVGGDVGDLVSRKDADTHV